MGLRISFHMCGMISIWILFHMWYVRERVWGTEMWKDIHLNIVRHVIWISFHTFGNVFAALRSTSNQSSAPCEVAQHTHDKHMWIAMQRVCSWCCATGIWGGFG